MATSKKAKQIMAKQIGKLPNRIHNPGRSGLGGMPSMGTHRKPVGYGQHGKAFYNVKKYNQSKSGRAHAAAAQAGHPLSQKPVGYGAKGKAFFSKAKYMASNAGRLKGAGGPGYRPLKRKK